MQKKFGGAARIAAGIIFVLAGLFKLLAARGEFAQMLTWAHVPLPRAVALAVPILEIGGGAAFLANRKTRIFAALLAGDMAAAIFLVGIPAKLGRVFRIRGHEVGTESWRLPLEIGLLIICVWLALKDKDAARET